MIEVMEPYHISEAVVHIEASSCSCICNQDAHNHQSGYSKSEWMPVRCGCACNDSDANKHANDSMDHNR